VPRERLQSREPEGRALQEPGTLIEGKYEILSKIREGGMGAIYKVRHRLLDEVRVVKVMRPQILADEELKQRFVEEAKTATRLKHPNICAIYDFALDDDGTAYLVMEYINGATLSELAHSGTPPGLAMSLEIAHQALLALGYLHRRNVVHRDIAPDNLMLTDDEEGRPLVKLIDLGIAKALDRSGGEMTSTGVFLGKLKYASPEQYGALPPGERIDGRSDLYSLGVVLYELLTGTRPFAGETPAELLRAHLLQPPAAFALTDPGGKVPEGLRAAVLKALEKKREDRFGSAEDFDREILHIQRELDPSSQRDSAVLLLSKLRGAPEKTSVTITPSAQNRLDRQFIAQATPHPGKTTLVSVPRATGRESSARTVVATPPPGSTGSISPPPPAAASDAGERAPRRPGRAIAALVVAAAAAAAAFLLFVRPRDQAAQAPSAAAAPPAVARIISPTAAPPLQSATSAGPAAAVPTIAAAEPRPTAELKRPTVQAPTPVRKPTVVIARMERPERSAPSVPTGAAPPPPAPRPAESQRVESTPSRSSAGVPAAESGRAAVEPKVLSDQDRIRDVVQRYERAQNALDAEQVTRLYPGANRSRLQAAFDGLRSQSVTFDRIRIDLPPGGTRATVRLHEQRVAVPKVGVDLRAEGERTILLQKEGENWVITGLQ
jgi:eukaryotic-like serine/threonine-protein kinase